MFGGTEREVFLRGKEKSNVKRREEKQMITLQKVEKRSTEQQR